MAALVSSPPENAMPTRSPTGKDCRMLLNVSLGSKNEPRLSHERSFDQCGIDASVYDSCEPCFLPVVARPQPPRFDACDDKSAKKGGNDFRNARDFLVRSHRISVGPERRKGGMLALDLCACKTHVRIVPAVRNPQFSIPSSRRIWKRSPAGNRSGIGQPPDSLSGNFDPIWLAEFWSKAFCGSGVCSAAKTGCSVHAGVSISAADRKGLKRLLRYAARPPIAADRLEQLPDGRLSYRL